MHGRKLSSSHRAMSLCMCKERREADVVLSCNEMRVFLLSRDLRKTIGWRNTTFILSLNYSRSTESMIAWRLALTIDLTKTLEAEQRIVLVSGWGVSPSRNRKRMWQNERKQEEGGLNWLRGEIPYGLVSKGEEGSRPRYSVLSPFRAFLAACMLIALQAKFDFKVCSLHSLMSFPR